MEAENASASLPPLLRRRILQNYLLVWVDDTIDETGSQCSHTLQQLRTVLDNLTVFTEPDSCVDFLQNVKNQRALVITSSSLGQVLIPQIHSMLQVYVIYIFDADHTPRAELWTQEWWKIQNEFTQAELLCDALRTSITQYNQDSTAMSYCLPPTTTSDNNLDQLEPSFMHTKLLKDAFLEMEYEDGACQDLLNYCRETRARSPVEKGWIDKFQREYNPDKAIWWYTQESFVYQMVNQALRLFEADIIVNMGFFIHDLHRQIEQVHKDQMRDHTGQLIKLYRGQRLSMAGLEKLKKNVGGLLAFNSFLSTTTERTYSLCMAESSIVATDAVGILFDISIDPTLTTTPFADVDKFLLDSGESEVLFTMHSVFRINQVTNLDQTGKVVEVQLILTTDDDEQLRALTKLIGDTVQGSVGWTRVGRLLIRAGQLGKAEELHMKLLEHPSDDDERAHFNHQLGFIKERQSDYTSALRYYEKSLELRQNALQVNHIELGTCYNNIGIVYQKLGRNNEALSCFQKALGVYQKLGSVYGPNLAFCYNNIGLVHSALGQYVDALAYYEKGFEMCRITLPENHPDLATSYKNIGFVYDRMGEYSNALPYYEKALEIHQKTLPDNHLDLANSYNSIGSLHDVMGNYSKALSCHQEALSIYQKTFSASHPNLAITYGCIGAVYSKMGYYSEARLQQEQALDIHRNHLPENHPDLAVAHNNLGYVLHSLGEYSNALFHYEKALDIHQKTLPENHPDFASPYNNIGFVYHKLRDYSKALTHYEKALDVNRKTLSATHPELAATLNNIGLTHYSMGQYSKALSFHTQALDIFQATLPEFHPTLSTSYNNIALVHCGMGQYLEALSYYYKARDTYEKNLPQYHPTLAEASKNIGSVWEQIGEYINACCCYKEALNIYHRGSLTDSHPEIRSTIEPLETIRKEL